MASDVAAPEIRESGLHTLPRQVGPVADLLRGQRGGDDGGDNRYPVFTRGVPHAELLRLGFQDERLALGSHAKPRTMLPEFGQPTSAAATPSAAGSSDCGSRCAQVARTVCGVSP